MVRYTEPLYQAAVEHQDQYRHLFRFLWFVGFAFWDTVIISLILYTHYHFKLKRSFCTNAIVLAYGSKFFLHWGLYIEKEFFTSKHLEPFYSIGIPSINALLAASLFGYLLLVSSSVIIQSNSKYKGFTWRI